MNEKMEKAKRKKEKELMDGIGTVIDKLVENAPEEKENKQERFSLQVNQRDYRYVAEAISSDYYMSQRIESLAELLCDMKRHANNFRVDSLMCGDMAVHRAKDAIFNALVVSILIAAEAKTCYQAFMKYREMEEAACDGRKKVDLKYRAQEKD